MNRKLLGTRHKYFLALPLILGGCASFRETHLGRQEPYDPVMSTKFPQRSYLEAHANKMTIETTGGDRDALYAGQESTRSRNYQGATAQPTTNSARIQEEYVETSDSRRTEADNSAKNRRDRAESTLTADQQARGSRNDVELTRLIRREIVKDDSLSTYAHNVKIITLQGMVTLRGPVRSVAERERISKYAAKIAGSGNVANDLEIAPK